MKQIQLILLVEAFLSCKEQLGQKRFLQYNKMWLCQLSTC